MSVSDIKIPTSTLAELRGVLVRALSRENLSVTDKLAIRKSQSSSALKIHYTAYYGGKGMSLFFHTIYPTKPQDMPNFSVCVIFNF
jgi:hypothetical protein